jgi:hypothetical protein
MLGHAPGLHDEIILDEVEGVGVAHPRHTYVEIEQSEAESNEEK